MTIHTPLQMGESHRQRGIFSLKCGFYLVCYYGLKSTNLGVFWHDKSMNQDLYTLENKVA